MRSPACGSPETRSTRSFSRMPSIVTTARLFAVVSSSASASASISTTFGPPCSIRTVSENGAPVRTSRRRICWPSRRTVTSAEPVPPRSSTWARTVWSLPTMPKRGASVSAMRRSRSSGRPVTSACSGARKPRSAVEAGMSCTTPSVTMTTPARRSGGTSASAFDSAENSRVPSSFSASPASTKRGSTSGIAPRRRCSSARTLSVIAARAPSVCEVERSITTATTSFTFSRSSWISDGLASAATTSASAAARTSATGPRDSAATRTSAATAAASAHRARRGGEGRS